MDRRVRKTQNAVREAFVALVLERGYDPLTVEDITDRADIARATFYAHFDDKGHLLRTLFEELTVELTRHLTDPEPSPDRVRGDRVRQLYEHAVEHRDLYLICLRGAGDGRARAAYEDTVAAAAETIFDGWPGGRERRPLIPLPILGRAFAGAHVALLSEWLERGEDTIEDVVQAESDLLAKGFSWALGIARDDALA